jgi:Trk-type K+ transport system membrane component
LKPHLFALSALQANPHAFQTVAPAIAGYAVVRSKDFSEIHPIFNSVYVFGMAVLAIQPLFRRGSWAFPNSS